MCIVVVGTQPSQTRLYLIIGINGRHTLIYNNRIKRSIIMLFVIPSQGNISFGESDEKQLEILSKISALQKGGPYYPPQTRSDCRSFSCAEVVSTDSYNISIVPIPEFKLHGKNCINWKSMGVSVPYDFDTLVDPIMKQSDKYSVVIATKKMTVSEDKICSIAIGYDASPQHVHFPTLHEKSSHSPDGYPVMQDFEAHLITEFYHNTTYVPFYGLNGKFCYEFNMSKIWEIQSIPSKEHHLHFKTISLNRMFARIMHSASGGPSDNLTIETTGYGHDGKYTTMINKDWFVSSTACNLYSSNQDIDFTIAE